MAKILRMPGISADAEEATLLAWTVAQGADIKAGDALAVVETEKANVDIDAEEDGVLWRIMADAGDSVDVGSPIAVVLAPGEDGGDESAILGFLGLSSSADGAAPKPKATDDPGINVLGTVSVGQMEPDAEAEIGAGSETPAGANSQSGTGSSAGQGAQRSRIFTSPIARRLARDSGLPLETLEGSGPDGRIVRADVEAAIARAAEAHPQQTAAPAPAIPPAPSEAAAPVVRDKTAGRQDSEGGYTDTPHSGIRKAIASALTSSKRDIPHFYLSATCRVDALLELRSTINSTSSVRVSINDFFVKAVAKTLRDMPEMNVVWTAEAVRQFDAVDVSVAIATEGGLVTPVLRSADSLTLTETSTRIRDFAARAAGGKLKQHEIQGGTFTVTNLGMFEVEGFSAIINPPQVGILAVGAVKKTPAVVNDQLVIANTVQVTVSADHRPVDGVLVAKWLQQFTKLIENPLLILT